MSFDIERRHGWPTELRMLLDRHPRSTWAARRDAHAEFWLDVHSHFRRDSVDLTVAAEEFRDGRRTAHELAVIAGPRLRMLIANLHGHHQVEDHRYFPAFREAEPRLAVGFDLLSGDHAALARELRATVDALRELRTVVAATAERVDRTAALAAQHYAAAVEGFCARLCRHLSDEEDLIVPLLIERRDY